MTAFFSWWNAFLVALLRTTHSFFFFAVSPQAYSCSRSAILVVFNKASIMANQPNKTFNSGVCHWFGVFSDHFKIISARLHSF